MDPETSGEIKGLREAVARAQRRANITAYFWLVLIVTAVGGPAVAVLVSRHLAIENERASERKLCAVVITSDEGDRANPPGTAARRTQASNIARLRVALGCPAHQENE